MLEDARLNGQRTLPRCRTIWCALVLVAACGLTFVPTTQAQPVSEEAAEVLSSEASMPSSGLQHTVDALVEQLAAEAPAETETTEDSSQGTPMPKGDSLKNGMITGAVIGLAWSILAMQGGCPGGGSKCPVGTGVAIVATTGAGVLIGAGVDALMTTDATRRPAAPVSPRRFTLAKRVSW